MDSRKRKRRKETLNNKLQLKHVIELGGDKEDYNLVKNIDDEPVSEDCHENVDVNEISNYITELGLKKFQITDLSKNSQKFESITDREKSVKNLLQKNSETENNESFSFKQQAEEGSDKKKKQKKMKKKLQVNEITSSTRDSIMSSQPSSISKTKLKQKSRDYILIKNDNGGKWFNNELTDNSIISQQITDEEVTKFRMYAEQLMQKDCELHRTNQESKSRKSDFHWIKTVLSTGALGDKIAAMVVLIQESPVHQLKTLENLIGMVNIKGKRECLKAADTLRDLFLSDLLPDNRKLQVFEQHPFTELDDLSSGNHVTKHKILLLWYFEDQLKKCYVNFINAIDAMSRDTVEATKIKAVNIMYELLVSHPEQEQVLLSKLVNKLGDPKYKIACQGCLRLTQLIQQHPNMKTVVVLEVERLLFRPNISPRAQYYGICFLNQIMLSEEESELAGRLITIYFSFFKLCIKKSEVDTKLMSGLLTGVNRAYPYAKVDMEKINEQINAIYKIVHTVSFPIAIQALLLIYHVLDSKQAISDRYYVALYRKLADPEIKKSSRQAVFLNLLYKSLRKDESSHRIRAFIKRILQISTYQSPPLVCGLLFLISELLKDKKGILKIQSIAELDDDNDDEEHFLDVDVDEDKQESAAISLSLAEDNNKSSFLEEVKTPEIKNPQLLNSGSSWLHRQNLKGTSRITCYDPFHRNPRYCGAEYTCVWELLYLSHHYHPSVSLFAETILNGEFIEYTGDPLQDFTLIRFLDRFVFRNPKKVSANTSVLGRRKLYKPKGIKGIPVNSENYIRRKEENVPPDEKFFYQYYSKKQRKPKDEDSDVDSDEAEEFLSKFVPNEGKSSKELDFASDMLKQSKKKSKKASKEELVSSEDEDEDIDFNEDDEFKEAFKDFDDDIKGIGNTSGFDEEVAEFSDEDSLINWEESADHKKKKKFGKKDSSFEDSNFPVKKSKRDKDNFSHLFAAAEEFSEMIDENVTYGLDTTTTEAFANKDNSDAKQIRWEQARDKWIRGKDWKTHKTRNYKGKSVFRQGKARNKNFKSNKFKRKG